MRKGWKNYKIGDIDFSKDILQGMPGTGSCVPEHGGKMVDTKWMRINWANVLKSLWEGWVWSRVTVTV